MEAWQAKKRALDEEKERAEEEAAANRKGWNLENDASDDEPPVATTPAEGMNVLADGEVDPLDEFMLDVGTKVQEDFATLDPAVAQDAPEVNEQLAKAGITLKLPSDGKGADNTDASVPADEEMKDAGTSAVSYCSICCPRTVPAHVDRLAVHSFYTPACCIPNSMRMELFTHGTPILY